jgi:hypothetical protein
MWWWWVFTFIYNCVWIFWFIARNAKNSKKSQNEFQSTTKHFFWQNYFVHIWPAPKAKHFEPIKHFFCQMVFKWVLCIVALSFKKFKLRNFCMIWFFIKFIQRTCTFIRRGMFLLYKKNENYIVLSILFYSFFEKV